jgi:hypothetical protein
MNFDKTNFDLINYKKYNIDLLHLSDEELIEHYHKIGKNQMRIFFPISFFRKEIVYIQTTKYGYYISNAIKYMLFQHFIKSVIIETIDYRNPNLHIILFSQKVQQFPKNYIIYQLEQKDISKWIDKKYEMSIYFSQKTWDYSYSNIYKFSTVLQKKITYLPIPLIPYHYLFETNVVSNVSNDNVLNDILFYGTMNEKRVKKLEYLNKKLFLKCKIKIKIVSNLFGKELFKEIKNSKIVLNIHFYENGILETNRMNEILSCDKIIISEKPNVSDNYNYDLYKNNIIFIDTLDEMYDKILFFLNDDNRNAFLKSSYYKDNYQKLFFKDIWKKELNI